MKDCNPMNTITEYEKLKETYSKNGMDYTLVKRNDKAAMYKQFTKEGLHTGYEVFIVKVNPEFKWPNGSIQKASEAFPYNEAGGSTLWTYMAKEQNLADRRYDEITNGQLRSPVIADEVINETPIYTGHKRGRGRPRKNNSNVEVKKYVAKNPRQKFMFNGTEYNSKSDVVRILLNQVADKKSIAQTLGITVQTVHAIFSKIRTTK